MWFIVHISLFPACAVYFFVFDAVCICPFHVCVCVCVCVCVSIYHAICVY